jgi:uncharacterized protein
MELLKIIIKNEVMKMADNVIERERLECRLGCGACCIAPSISSPIPGMPNGKPAGVRCTQLTKDNLCKIFGSNQRPAVCSSLKPSREMCKSVREEAMEYLEELERVTSTAT